MPVTKIKFDVEQPPADITVLLYRNVEREMPALGTVEYVDGEISFNVDKDYESDFGTNFVAWSHVLKGMGVRPNSVSCDLPEANKYVVLYPRDKSKPLTIGWASFWNTGEFAGFTLSNQSYQDKHGVDFTHWCHVEPRTDDHSTAEYFTAKARALSSLMDSHDDAELFLSSNDFSRSEIVRCALVKNGVRQYKLGSVRLVNIDTYESRAGKIVSIELVNMRFITSKHAEYSGYKSRHELVSFLKRVHEGCDEFTIVTFISDN